MSHLRIPSHRRMSSTESADAAGARPWLLLFLMSAAQFMVVLDITVVNVALPSIGRSLRFASADLQWVVSAYVLVTGGLTLLGGRAADLLGRRRIFLAGLALFTTASLASGLAPDAGALVAARAAQGIGAALLTPAALAIITAAYSGAQRATALSVWGALAAGGSAVGLLAGGMLTTWLGWRWVFLINVPIGLITALLSAHLVPAAAPADDRRNLDLAGALLLVAGIGTAVYAITGVARYGWGSARTLLLLALAAGLLAAFGVTEGRVRAPLVPPRALRSRFLVTGALTMLTGTGLLIGVLFLSSLYLQNVLHASPIRTGLEFLPLVLTTGAGAHLSARYIRRAGSRLLAVAGLVAMAAGALVLSQVNGYPDGLLPGFLLLGSGAGLVFPAASVTAMHTVARDEAGLAAGIVTTGHEVGAALGVAVFAALAAATTGFAAAGPASATAFRHVFAIGAVIAAGLAVIAALTVPPVRPAAEVRVGMH